MMKLAALLAFTIACGGGGSDVGGSSSTQPDGGVALDGSAPTDASSPSNPDAAVTTAGPATRAVISGARRLHGANGLIVDVEVGHALDQGVRTSGPLIVRGGAANLGN